jgi:hypothetical protein
MARETKAKEETKMKEKLSNKMGFLGAGIGITLFAIFGLQPGAFMGGLLGLNAANLIIGAQVEPTLVVRLLVTVGMLAGVMVTGLMFTVVGAIAGWISGRAADAASRHGKSPAVAEAHR